MRRINSLTPILKKIAPVVIAALAIVVLAGCDISGEPEVVKTTGPRLSKQEPKKSTSLEEIQNRSAEALDLATETVDFHEEDTYLDYVDEKRDETKKEYEEEQTEVTDGLLGTLTNAVSDMASDIADAFTDLFSGSGQTDSGGSSGSSGESSGGSSGSSGGSTTGNKYSDSTNGFQITFPSGWAVSEGTDGDKDTVTATSPSSGSGDDYLEKITVAVEELALERSLADYTDEVVESLDNNLTDFNEVQHVSDKLGDLDVTKVIYTYKSGGDSMKAVVFIVPVGLKGYTITGIAEADQYSTYDDYFRASADTFGLI